jgi:hypothetical protein
MAEQKNALSLILKMADQKKMMNHKLNNVEFIQQNFYFIKKKVNDYYIKVGILLQDLNISKDISSIIVAYDDKILYYYITNLIAFIIKDSNVSYNTLLFLRELLKSQLLNCIDKNTNKKIILFYNCKYSYFMNILLKCHCGVYPLNTVADVQKFDRLKDLNNANNLFMEHKYHDINDNKYLLEKDYKFEIYTHCNNINCKIKIITCPGFTSTIYYLCRKCKLNKYTHLKYKYNKIDNLYCFIRDIGCSICYNI